jgi:hypothetical protein
MSPGFTAFVRRKRRAPHADDETRQIVFAGRVQPGHFRRFAADQRASGGMARADIPSTTCSTTFGVHAAMSQIVQEKQRLGALRQNVVDAVIDQIGADGRMNAHAARRSLVSCRRRRRWRPAPARAIFCPARTAAERADPADHAARERARSEAPDALLGLIRGRNIHACFGVVHEPTNSFCRGERGRAARSRKLEHVEDAAPANLLG